MPAAKAPQCRAVASGLQKRKGAVCRAGRAPRAEVAGRRTEPERTSAFQLQYIHDGIVQLSQHHKVDGKAGGAVLGGRIAREPGERVVLLQNKP